MIAMWQFIAVNDILTAQLLHLYHKRQSLLYHWNQPVFKPLFSIALELDATEDNVTKHEAASLCF